MRLHLSVLATWRPPCEMFFNTFAIVGMFHWRGILTADSGSNVIFRLVIGVAPTRNFVVPSRERKQGAGHGQAVKSDFSSMAAAGKVNGDIYRNSMENGLNNSSQNAESSQELRSPSFNNPATKAT